MALSSPRKTFRGLRTLPLEFQDPDVQLVAQAIKQLQELSLLHPVEVKSTAASYTLEDHVLAVLGDATTGNVTITLLSAVGRKGRRVIVKKTDATANLVIIDPNASETIDGSTTLSLTQQYAVREMVSDGTNWQLVAAIGNATAL